MLIGILGREDNLQMCRLGDLQMATNLHICTSAHLLILLELMLRTLEAIVDRPT